MSQRGANAQVGTVTSVVRATAEPQGVSPHRTRLVDATLACLAAHGTAKTTVEDIARRAGLSRATVYRTFPGGRDEVLAAVVATETARLFSLLGLHLGAADDLEDALAEGLVVASSWLLSHPALTYLIANEPEVVLGHLAFAESEELLATASLFLAPFLARWMAPEEAGRVAEWATRIVLSYTLSPSPFFDLSDRRAARRLVATFVLPGVRALHAAAAASAVVSLTSSAPSADENSSCRVTPSLSPDAPWAPHHQGVLP